MEITQLADEAKARLRVAYASQLAAMPASSTFQDFADANIGEEGGQEATAYLYDCWQYGRAAEKIVYQEIDCPDERDNTLPGVGLLREALSRLDDSGVYKHDGVARRLDGYLVAAMWLCGYKFLDDKELRLVVKQYRPADFVEAIRVAAEVRREVRYLMSKSELPDYLGEMPLQDISLLRLTEQREGRILILDKSYNEMVAEVLADTICYYRHTEPRQIRNLVRTLLEAAPSYDPNRKWRR